MSKCRKLVTCKIYDYDMKLLSEATNIAHCDGNCTNPRGATNGICRATHAEIAALNKLKKTNKPFSAVVNWPPCYDCYKTMIAAGIRIIYANF